MSRSILGVPDLTGARDRAASEGGTAPRRWARVLDPVSLAVGGVFGVLVCQAVHDSAFDVRPTRGGGPVLRICMYCKGIPRVGGDGRDHWVPLEQALYDAEGIEFSHGACPRCYTAHLEPQINNWKRKKTWARQDASEEERGAGQGATVRGCECPR
ncbi:MAG: hypothetical protein HY900_20445 [Deltaproteobacteria bacterium]|nr:hypothetical protein [Deltaproteobacteria bacterium]